MAESSSVATRVVAVLLGLGAAVGGYAVWQASQRPDAIAPDAPVADDAPPEATAEPVPATATVESAPDVPPAPEALPTPMPPTFDLVRVEADGAALIAGTAPADARISLKLDGIEALRVQAGPDGAFVAQFVLAPNPAPRLLSMVASLPDGTELAADGTVAIAPIAAPPPVATTAPEPAPDAPAAILLTDEGAEVIQGPAPIAAGEKIEIGLDTIAYAPDGAVQLSGRGQGDQSLRIYLDNAAVMDAKTGADGKWAVTLPAVVPGIYTLRIDQMAADGAVSSRFETPFKRETLDALASVTEVAPAPAAEAAPEPEVVAETVPATDPVAEPAPEVAPVPETEPVAEVLPEPAPEPADVAEAVPPVITPAADVAPVVAEPAKAVVTVTVQPGFTLWGIATERFGEGTMYVQVFEANRDSIKDPDLIYPGQVFTLPQE